MSEQTLNGAAASASRLDALIADEIARAGGWIGFERFMSLALYAPGLGYYAGGRQKFGLMPDSGSDFVTAPELSPLFGQALARQVAQALAHCDSDTVYEFGAGSGALAEQLLEALGEQVQCYAIVDLSGELRQRQAERLARFGARVRWLDQLPQTMRGVVVGNEVLDAMPVQILRWDGQEWRERGVARQEGAFVWAERPAEAPQGLDEGTLQRLPPGALVERHAQAEGFVRTLAERLQRGVVLLFDYGFPEHEYYHPQRHAGTLMCHHLHQADPDPLVLVGEKDITAHVNFTGIALAAQEAGLTVLGYTSQAHFLLNCGVAELMGAADLAQRTMAHKLIAEHEMGELFKVIALVAGEEFDAIGFSRGDRCHQL